MKIKNYKTGETIFKNDSPAMRETVKAAVKAGISLAGADLTDAYLRGADLAGADLYGADLRGAYLAGADLANAYLRGADLRGADLSGADLGRVDVPLIPDIDAQILARIEAGGKLEMGDWHTCDTTHCRAGWAVVVAGEKGAALESRVGTNAAAALLYVKAGRKIPDFYTSNDAAMASIRDGAKGINL